MAQVTETLTAGQRAARRIAMWSVDGITNGREPDAKAVEQIAAIIDAEVAVTIADTREACAAEYRYKIERLESELDSARGAARTLGSQLNRAIESSPEYDHRDKNY